MSFSSLENTAIHGVSRGLRAAYRLVGWITSGSSHSSQRSVVALRVHRVEESKSEREGGKRV